ncbi:MAG: hypothetical protein ACPL1A_10050, partial [Candidatus Kapaibacteriota bacterium]
FSSPSLRVPTCRDEAISCPLWDCFVDFVSSQGHVPVGHSERSEAIQTNTNGFFSRCCSFRMTQLYFDRHSRE